MDDDGEEKEIEVVAGWLFVPNVNLVLWVCIIWIWIAKKPTKNTVF